MNISFCERSLTRGRRTLLAFFLLPTVVFAAEEPAPEKTKTLPAAILRKYDADHDGRLSDSERTAWKEDVQRGRAEAQARRLERFDANHDGKLDKAEKAEAAKAGNAKADESKGGMMKSEGAKASGGKAGGGKTSAAGFGGSLDAEP